MFSLSFSEVSDGAFLSDCVLGRVLIYGGNAARAKLSEWRDLLYKVPIGAERVEWSNNVRTVLQICATWLLHNE